MDGSVRAEGREGGGGGGGEGEEGGELGEFISTTYNNFHHISFLFSILKHVAVLPVHYYCTTVHLKPY